MAKMRAMVLEKTGPIEGRPLELQEIDRHEIGDPSEILIRIEACGVCHSQLHRIEGDWDDSIGPRSMPIVPGHEIVGIVEETGSAASKFKIGDRVGVSPLRKSCQKCRYCTGGKEQLCDDVETLGEDLKGGYAEYVTVSEDFATLVPKDMDPRYAAPLFCAGITAYKAVHASDPAPQRSLGIFGVGGVGHMAVQFAKVAGSNAVAVSRNTDHLELAKKLGASHTVEYAGKDETLRRLREGPGLLDSAIILAPSDEVTETAIAAVRKGGTIVMATLGEVRGFVSFEEKTLRGTLIGSMKEMAEVIRIAGQEGLSVVYEEHKLEEANEVLKRLKDSQIEARAVLVP